ncbi:MAG: CRISPR-associated protein Cas4 [Lachnospiraceae bacterium]|nr:CRISPR-associated protein Cas4 [Lachnospiraceae bacterium]
MTENSREEKMITGLMFYYYWVCKRKLWYFYHEIGMEQGNENVQLGKLLDENTYKREEKHINIDNVINIDFIADKKILHEIKKSRKIEEAGIWQVKYYLYYLKKRGVSGIIGKNDYPLLKQSLEVTLSETDEQEIEQILDNINHIVSMDEPLPYEKKKICASCAFFDLCAI